MDLSALERMGLSRAEVRVYEALLRLGSTSLGKVVDETSLRKSTVYECIKRLQDKGLVSYVVKDSMKYFEASPPEHLLDFVNEKKKELTLQEKQLNALIPKLKSEFGSSKPIAQAHVYLGVEGFKTMRRDSLRNANGEILLIGAISREDEVMPGFYKWWNKERQANKIGLKILHKESARKKAMAKKKFMGKYFHTKFLPEELESPAVINIYGNRVVNVLWKNNEPICFLLINKDIADSYRKYFAYLWKQAKR